MEDVIRRYKLIKTKVGVIEERLRGMKGVIGELPPDLTDKPPQELEEMCKERLDLLEQAVTKASVLLEEVEKLRIDYG